MATSNDPASRPQPKLRGPVDANAALAGRLRLVREEVAGAEGAGAMARSLGVPEGTWANFEAGVAIPGHVLLAFVVATSVEPRWLLTGAGPRYREDLGGTDQPGPSPEG